MVGSSFTNESTGIIGGLGEYDFSATGLTNFGVIDPGLSPGQLTLDGDVILGSSSVIKFEIGGVLAGDQYDVLTITQDLALAGGLQITLIDGFESRIRNADSFNLLTAGNLVGTFDGLADGSTVFTEDGRGQFTLNYLGSSIVVSNFVATVPEP